MNNTIKLAEAEQRILELEAHCENQSLALLEAIHHLPGGDAKAYIRDVYDDTPKQSLAKHDADVIRKLVTSLTTTLSPYSDHRCAVCRLIDLTEYADRLEGGEL